MKNTIIIQETITVGEEVLTEVDPMILASMRERLNPSKPFSYANNDHTKQAEENERKMREGK